MTLDEGRVELCSAMGLIGVWMQQKASKSNLRPTNDTEMSVWEDVSIILFSVQDL